MIEYLPPLSSILLANSQGGIDVVIFWLAVPRLVAPLHAPTNWAASLAISDPHLRMPFLCRSHRRSSSMQVEALGGLTWTERRRARADGYSAVPHSEATPTGRKHRKFI
ncbi:hypothetical protein SUGI_0779500 [Cryptomeria japonica]|nr:hypothetical protein SUGI_0779500 [Cryptomeria japonica]